MARLIGATGTVYYNGVTFPPALHSKIQVRPVEQIGGVNRKYLNCTINVDTVLTYTDPPLSNAVTAPTNMGSNMTFYRRLLTEYRKTLVFGEQGFGDIVVNAAANGYAVPVGYTSMNDVAFGPKPRLLVWEPVGSNASAHVSWVCETNIVDCISESSAARNKLLEVTYETSFNINQEGLLTRTVRATIEIAALTSGSQFLDTVDNYTNRFSPKRVDGFHRETHRLISRDHRVMQITYTDTEIATDNPFPAGMVDIRASQDLRSNLEKDGFTRWISTLSGTMRWGKNVPRSWAWGAFAAILAQRFQAKANAPVFLNNTSRSSIAGRSIPIDINISEELFDREANFSVSWATVVDLNSLFQTTKMFQPLQNLTWAQWHSSLTQLQSPQGGSNMTEKANDIKVVDVCGNQVPALPNTKIAPLNSSFGQAWFDFSCGSIRPEASWLDGGTPTVRIINDSNALPQIPAYGPDATTVTPPDPSHTARSSGSNPANTVQSGTPAGYEPTYQTRSYNTYMIEVRGSFTRVCYEPYEPVFTSYGGVDLVLLKSEHTVKKTNGQFFPIYTLDYVQTYYLERLPEGSPHLVLRHDAGKGDR